MSAVAGLSFVVGLLCGVVLTVLGGAWLVRRADRAMGYEGSATAVTRPKPKP